MRAFPVYPALAAVLALSACQENSIGTRNSAPTVSITSHFDGDQVVEGIPFLVRASAGDADNLLEDLQATWYAANELVGECNKVPLTEDGLSECTVVLFPDSDPARISVDVRDPRGASGNAAVKFEVLPQQNGYHPPSATIVAPAEGALVLGGQPTVFEGEVSDLQDPPTALALEWTSSVDGLLNTAGADSSGTALFVQPSLSSGIHVLTLRVTDTEGNFTTDVSTITVNGAPTAPVVSIAPSPAPSSRDLQATLDVPSTDPEGDPVSYTWEWLKDGVVQAGQTSALVLAAQTARGETWTARAHPSDGLSQGAFGEASVLVENAAPVVNSVTLGPVPATTNTVLAPTVVAVDADGDPVSLAYRWEVDGVDIGQSGASLDGLVHFERGELVQVFVTPNDGSADGAELGSNVVLIENSPPTQPGVSVSPVVPVEQVDDLICALDLPSTDADGDALTYDFAWDVDGVAYPRVGDAGPFQTVWPDDSADGADTLDGEVWTCTATATDSAGLGSVPGTDAVTVGSVVFTPDYDGIFDIVPDISYTCASGLVNLSVTQLTFSDSAGTLSVSGATTVMRQTPTPIDENFSATGVITGGCTETYTVSGSFQDNDWFIGTMNLSFTGWQCGLTNCVNQTWPVDGYRL